MAWIDWPKLVNLLLLPATTANIGGLVDAVVAHHFKLRRLEKEWLRRKEEPRLQ